jgi:hypothetical protein
MRRIFLLPFLSFTFWQCSSSTSTSSLPEDFRAIYYTRGVLTDFELKMQVTKEQILLNFSDRSQNLVKNLNYTLSEDDVVSLYKSFRSADFMNMTSPPGEHITDAPLAQITATYKNKTHTVDFGQVKTPPESIAKLRDGIFAVMTKYKSDWKKEIGWE